MKTHIKLFDCKVKDLEHQINQYIYYSKYNNFVKLYIIQTEKIEFSPRKYLGEGIYTDEWTKVLVTFNEECMSNEEKEKILKINDKDLFINVRKNMVDDTFMFWFDGDYYKFEDIFELHNARVFLKQSIFDFNFNDLDKLKRKFKNETHLNYVLYDNKIFERIENLTKMDLQGR